MSKWTESKKHYYVSLAGHKSSAGNGNGKCVYPSKDKVRDMHDALAPTNVKEVQVFLKLVNYYDCFVL